ncbi:tRNA pseudouridine(38-40) synthase TruA [Corynebacterium sp. HMSC034A01]|uniref:tRNA pseudouridine(38-40) synthase TruA n=1 Tax=Corynebacterium sp. HMSC034A01 TaxID=1739295 RepID=UPI0008A9E50B|nr:tRNA pseudouridine(38-40) synthase TruA [Corynebacterium sp. HMSC034A01]OHR21311.1 tRNA pseudouridine(38-40) synthase [Corynebacterium sp. HMSC034A01]
MDDTLRLRLDIAYDGTDFHGWARQKGDLRTVQQTIEDALSLVLRADVALTVAGRTDAGVHAAGQVAHADIPSESLNQRSIEGDPGRLVRRLAKLLPEDVRVFGVAQAPAGFDARFSALTRTYCYRVTTHPAGAVPTRARDTAVWPKPVDLGAVQACADALVGLNNFAAFCRPKEHGTTIREVHSFTWREVEPHLYEARITADAFCWNMVRALVATCLTVGEGRRAPQWPEELLLLDARSPDVPLAPARGLTLVGVEYPEDADLAARAEATRATREM